MDWSKQAQACDPPVVWLLGLLLISAPEPVGIEVLEAGEVSVEETRSVLSEIEAALRRLGREPVPLQASDRGGPSLGLALRIYGAVRYLRIEVERRGPGPGEPRAEIDLRNDPELWRVDLEHLLLGLLGPAPPQIVDAVAAPAPLPPRSPSMTHWVFGGVGAVALAIGIGFGVSSASARDQAKRADLSAPEFDGYAGRTRDHAIIADVSFIIAAVSALGAASSWAAD